MRLKSFFWLIVALLLAAGFVYAEGRREAPTAVVSDGMPQYGGTLNVLLGASQFDPPSPDMADGHNAQAPWLYPIQEQYILGDFEKYGPRGTGEYAFNVLGDLPETYWIGNLIESWEVSPEKLIWHVRRGIHWAPNEKQRAWMEPRELVAEDIVYYQNYFKNECPAGQKINDWLGDIVATDRYTIEMDFIEYNRYWAYEIAYEDRSYQGPPEMFERDPKVWENQIGTGPFMFKEYVRSSHMTYARNPDYWKTTPVDGEEFEYPFVDEMKFYILPDEATRVAATRTGRIDFYHLVQTPEAGDDLVRTTPDLDVVQSFGRAFHITINFKNEILSDVDVRRALVRGTNIAEHMDLYGAGRSELYFTPLLPQLPRSVYTPREELPAHIRELYDYNPDEARKMLADAGYPHGLKIPLLARSDALWEDHASLIQDQWSKFGVDVEIQIADATSYNTMKHGKTFPALFIDSDSSGDVYASIVRRGQTGGATNWGHFSDPEYDRLVDQILTSLDSETHDSLVKQAAVRATELVRDIPLFPLVTTSYHWPWVRNYYGEVNVAEKQMIPVIAAMWIDQNMKNAMGF